MLLRYPFKSYLYHYGLKFGAPFGFLRSISDTLDALRRPFEFLKRRRAAATVVSASKWRNFIPRNTKCRRFDSGEIPGLERLVEIGREIYVARGGDAIERPDGNPFATILKKSDFETYPEIMDIALSPPIVEIMCDYFGTVPRLDCVDLWATPKNMENSGGFGSQLFHLDKPEQHYTTLFLNVLDVEEENGPLVLLPADKSASVRRKTKYEKLYYLGNGRLPDAELKAHIGADDLISLTGPTGSGGIVDTSECFHAGSRCRMGRRLLFILSFLPAHKGGTKRFEDFLSYASDGDTVRRFLLQEPAIKA